VYGIKEKIDKQGMKFVALAESARPTRLSPECPGAVRTPSTATGTQPILYTGTDDHWQVRSNYI